MWLLRWKIGVILLNKKLVMVSIRKFRISKISIRNELNTKVTIRFDSKFQIFAQHYSKVQVKKRQYTMWKRVSGCSSTWRHWTQSFILPSYSSLITFDWFVFCQVSSRASNIARHSSCTSCCCHAIIHTPSNSHTLPTTAMNAAAKHHHS